MPVLQKFQFSATIGMKTSRLRKITVMNSGTIIHTRKAIKTLMLDGLRRMETIIMDMLLTEEDENQPLYADSAYTGAKLEQAIMEHKMSNQVCEKGYRNNPLTTEQQANNRIKSKTRARVEHVFGFMEQSMRGLYIWSIGLPRATGILGLINLTYNIFRYKQLIRRTA